jgi:hypothetical protein
MASLARCVFVAFFTLIALLPSVTARADAIGDWNQIANRTLADANVAGNARARAVAMTHAAMFEAVNAVEKRYTPIVARLDVAPGASATAAAAAAAHGILAQAAPGQKSRLDQALAEAVAGVADADARAAGIAVGERAASAIWADRQDDALSAPDTYRPHTTPGVWVPTTAPLSPEYARARLWGAARNDAYRPGPPPALNSAQYASDYNEVKSLGGRVSTTRTAAQTDAVRYWGQPNFTAAADQVTRQFTEARKLGLSESARLSAQMTMAVANTFMADWDAKFQYNFWRPVTAIRNGDQDGNDATERDAGWSPLNATPMHPEYPSQAAMIAAVIQAVIERHFGTDAGPVTVADTANPQLKRTFASVADLATEMKEVRIWGGIHFRTSLATSAVMGKRIADDVIGAYMKPR